jgi:hypothetical protein
MAASNVNKKNVTGLQNHEGKMRRSAKPIRLIRLGLKI